MAENYIETGRMFGPKTEVAPVSTSAPSASGSLMAVQSPAERARRDEATKRQRAYEDNYADELERRIRDMFIGANADELVKVIDATNNPLKRLTNSASVLYETHPARKLSDSTSTALYRQILSDAGAEVVFPRLNPMVSLHNTVLVYVRPAHDSLTLRLILPQDAAVIPDPDDPTMPLCVEFAECEQALGAKPVYHQFDRRPSSAGYYKYDANGKLLETLKPQYFDGDRPLIPIVAFHRAWPLSSFWDSTSGKDFYELTMMVGVWETFINHLLRTDSYRQKYATGDIDVTAPADGGTTAIMPIRSVGGTPISVGEFSSQADWMGIGAQIERKFRNVLDANGLVLPDTRTSGDPTSGFALMVRSQGLTKIQNAQKPSYSRSERTLYRAVAAVWNFERNNTAFPLIVGPELPPVAIAKPTIAYAAVESGKTVEEREVELRIAESEIRLGLASPITVFMGMHPEATEEEARAAIEKNKADTDALKPEPFGQKPDAESEPEADAEME